MITKAIAQKNAHRLFTAGSFLMTLGLTGFLATKIYYRVLPLPYLALTAIPASLCAVNALAPALSGPCKLENPVTALMNIDSNADTGQMALEPMASVLTQFVVPIVIALPFLNKTIHHAAAGSALLFAFVSNYKIFKKNHEHPGLTKHHYRYGLAGTVVGSSLAALLSWAIVKPSSSSRGLLIGACVIASIGMLVEAGKEHVREDAASVAVTRQVVAAAITIDPTLADTGSAAAGAAGDTKEDEESAAAVGAAAAPVASNVVGPEESERIHQSGEIQHLGSILLASAVLSFSASGTMASIALDVPHIGVCALFMLEIGTVLMASKDTTQVAQAFKSLSPISWFRQCAQGCHAVCSAKSASSDRDERGPLLDPASASAGGV